MLYLLSSVFLCVASLRRTQKMEIGEIHRDIDLPERRERFEAALIRLKSMKDRVAELRVQCESLRKFRAGKTAESVLCAECGREVPQGQEVIVKGPSGEPHSSYHRDCFKAIWASESWRVSYSRPGFLRLSRDSR